MEVNEIKNKMLNYIDFYGNSLLERDIIEKCKTKEELFEIIDSHSQHINDMENDAQSSLSRFRKQLNQ